MREAYQGAWGVLVLTYAPELRERLRDARLFKAARRAGVALVEQWLLELHDLGKGWRLGVVNVDHPEGDKTPGVWKPHHNLLFPCLAFGPGGGRTELRYSLPLEALTELRERWRWFQELLLGASLGRSADVWYQFRKGERKKGHALKYFPRTFPAWPARAQRLVYHGAFGSAVLHKLKEVKQLKETAADELCCLVCRGELVRWEYPEGHIPSRFRCVQGPALHEGGP
ncbi:MAG: hypothetical protein ACYCWW_00190 [Deltaproteobacteria bacterium]